MADNSDASEARRRAEAERQKLEELQLYLENAVDQLTRAQRMLIGSTFTGREKPEDPQCEQITQLLQQITVARNEARQRLMKALSGKLRVIQ